MSKPLRIFIIVAVLAFAADSATKEVYNRNGGEPRIFENKIKAAILKLLEKLKDEGIPSQNISSLDPLHVQTFETEMKNALAKLDLNLTDSDFIGLTAVDIPNIKFNIAGMTFALGLNWKLVHGVGSYGMKGTIAGLLPMFGGGDFEVDIENLLVNVTTKLGTDENKFVQLKDFKIYISVEKTNFHLTGLYNNEKLSNFTSQLISKKLPGLINKFKGTISMLLSPQIAQIGNKLLENKTINDIIGGLTKNDYTDQIIL